MFCLSLMLLLFGNTVYAQNEPRIHVRVVPFSVEYVKNEVVYTEEETISSNNPSDLYMTKQTDMRDENGTGFVYYCYGRKFGYC